MASILDPHITEITELRRRYGVARLELLGSATADSFDPERSDLDVLVEFDANSSGLFDRYFGLKESLEALYGRPVDLVTRGSLRNPYSLPPSTRPASSCMRTKTPKLFEDTRDAAAFIGDLALAA